MQLEFQTNGNLTEGIHKLTLSEFEEFFAFNDYRITIFEGLKLGLNHLKICGCSVVYVDGSFVSKKPLPGDFDACWNMSNVNQYLITTKYYTLIDFAEERKAQKLKYKGEFFPLHFDAEPGKTYLEFFQQDKDGNPKGIVQINLNDL